MYRPSHALLHHPFQKGMIYLQKSLRVGTNGLITAKAVSVLFIRRQAVGGFFFGFQDDRNERMAFLNDLPEGILHPAPVTGPGNKKVISLSVSLGDKRFPERMNAMLVSKLAIVVCSGVKGHMGVRQIMPDFRREFQDTGGLTGFHGFYKVPESFFQMPGEDAMRIQSVQGIFFYGILPSAGNRRLIPIQVNVVPWRFPRKGHAALIGFRGLPRQVLNMRPIKRKKRIRQRENRQTVDTSVRPEAPAVCQSY